MTTEPRRACIPPGYYSAYFLDPDGNNLEVVHHGPAQRSAPSVVVTVRMIGVRRAAAQQGLATDEGPLGSVHHRERRALCGVGSINDAARALAAEAQILRGRIEADEVKSGSGALVRGPAGGPAMRLTPHVSANEVLRDLIERLQIVFADQVVSVCLYGSAVAGDFDPDRSDLDLVVACSFEVEARLHDLERLHGDLAVTHPSWDDRVDVIYVPVAALRSFRSQPSRTAFISPGEPLHLTDTSQHIINWYLLQEQGQTLLGLPPTVWMPTITSGEFLAEVRAHLHAWPSWIALSVQPGFHAYAVLTICRACTSADPLDRPPSDRPRFGPRREYPQWSGLIEHSLAWRSQPGASNPAPRAVEFVDFAVREVAGSDSGHGTGNHRCPSSSRALRLSKRPGAAAAAGCSSSRGVII